MKKEQEMQKDEFLYPDEDFEKKVKKGINRSIYLKTLKLLLCLSLTISLVTVGFSKLLDITNYDPTTENDFLENHSDDSLAGFNVLSAVYLNMYFPGSVCQNIIDYEHQGFGNYQISLPITNIFEPIAVGVGDELNLKISRSSVKVDGNARTLLITRIYEYLNPNDTKEDQAEVLAYGSPKDQYDDIVNLPDSAIIDVAISFPQTKNSQEIVQFIQQYPDSWFHWIALETDELMVHGSATGFSLYDLWQDELKQEVENNYPSFYLLNSELDKTTLVEHYLSQLKLLSEHPEFTKMMDNTFHSKIIDYEAKYQEVLENGIHAIGLRAQVTKQDLIDMIDHQEVSHITIHQAKLSKYS